MVNNKVKARIDEILIDHLGIDEDQIRPDADLVNDLGADSLDTVELTMAFEEEFRIEIPDEDAETHRTVSAIYLYLEERISPTYKPPILKPASAESRLATAKAGIEKEIEVCESEAANDPGLRIVITAKDALEYRVRGLRFALALLDGDGAKPGAERDGKL